MFGSSKDNGKQQKSTPTGSTALNSFGVGTLIEGEVKSDGDVRIDGKLIGVITSKAKIVIGPTGVIEGDLYCQNADIQGQVFGKLDIKELLFLKSTSKIEGDIRTNKLVVEKGAQFNGHCRMGVQELKSASNNLKRKNSGEKIAPPLQKEAI